MGAFGAVGVDAVPPGVDGGVGTDGGASVKAGLARDGAVELEADVQDKATRGVIGVGAVAEGLVEVAFVVAVETGGEFGGVCGSGWWARCHGFSVA
jgi:hypothetical protein